MSKLTSLNRQLEIIRIARKGPFDWAELDKHLDLKSNDLNLTTSKRTLNRDLREIEQLFGLVIEFDFKTGKYFLNKEESSEKHSEIMDAFDTIQAFGRTRGLIGKVFFEQKQARGTEYLKPILEAIESSFAIRIDYKKYWQGHSESRTIRPIALKEYLNRWYVVAWNEADYLRLYGLDRIISLETIQEKIRVSKRPDLDSRFFEVIGIINPPDEPVETVILTFTSFKGQYIKSLPLHPTQQILKDDEEVLQISLRVKINYELISIILSHGDEVKVDHPQRLESQIKEIAKNIFQGNLS